MGNLCIRQDYTEEDDFYENYESLQIKYNNLVKKYNNLLDDYNINIYKTNNIINDYILLYKECTVLTKNLKDNSEYVMLK